MKGGRVYDVCAACDESVYQNTHPQRDVTQWVHKQTGGKYCDHNETSVAAPRATNTTITNKGT